VNTVATAAKTEASKVVTVRHSAVVRVAHWLTFLSCTALLVTGLLIVISHPRFYWGETGSNLTRPLFTLPIPASRDMVPTGYHYVMPDENGWSRYLHFEMAWVLVITGAVYLIYGVWSGHFRRNLLPERGGLSLNTLWSVVAKYLRGARPEGAEGGSYNAMQRVTYLAVIFVLVPLMIWTGLALSPAFDSAVPAAVNLLGGRQSARTLHFLLTWVLVSFVAVHVTMVAVSGFWKRMRGMITGR